jgi:hypothetical protein
VHHDVDAGVVVLVSKHSAQKLPVMNFATGLSGAELVKQLTRLDGAIIFEELAAGCTSTAAYITIHNRKVENNLIHFTISTLSNQQYTIRLDFGFDSE